MEANNRDTRERSVEGPVDSRERKEDRDEIEEGDERHHKKKHKHRSRSKDRKKSEKKKHRDRDDEGRDKDKDKEKAKDKEREREREREKGKEGDRRSVDRLDKGSDAIGRDERDRKRDGDRDRDRNTDRDRVRDKDRDREREREWDRERHKEREKEQSRERLAGDKGPEKERSRERERGRSVERKRDRERDKDHDRDQEDRARPRQDVDEGHRQTETPRVTLNDILRDNPGISMQDAVQRLHLINVAAAAASGEETLMAMRHHAISNINASTGITGVGGAATKSLREIYVGNLPPSVTVPQLIEFMNAAMKQLGSTAPRGSVVSGWISSDGHYAFTEFSTVEEANAAIAYLNGFAMGSAQLRIGRPSGFKPVPGMSTSTGNLGPGSGGLGALSGILGATSIGFSGGLGSVVNPMSTGGVLPAILSAVGIENNPDLQDVCLLSNLPLVLDKEQAKELVSSFGEVASFNLIKDPSGESQAAVFKYVKNELAREALVGFGELILAGRHLVGQHVPANMAAVLLKPVEDVAENSAVIGEGASPAALVSEGDRAAFKETTLLAALPPSQVLRLEGAGVDDLDDNDLFDEMLEDLADEFNKHGTVRSLVVPRSGDGRGLIFVQFTAIESAVRARAAMDTRTFNGNDLMAAFFPDELFVDKKYRVPLDYSVSRPKATEEDLD